LGFLLFAFCFLPFAFGTKGSSARGRCDAEQQATHRRLPLFPAPHFSFKKSTNTRSLSGI
jgi:hypothetical protein